MMSKSTASIVTVASWRHGTGTGCCHTLLSFSTVTGFDFIAGIDFRSQGTENIQNETNDHQGHAEIKDYGRGKGHIAEEGKEYFDAIGLESFTAKEGRHQTSRCSHRES